MANKKRISEENLPEECCWKCKHGSFDRLSHTYGWCIRKSIEIKKQDYCETFKKEIKEEFITPVNSILL